MLFLRRGKKNGKRKLSGAFGKTAFLPELFRQESR
jgi:hypothetical protein